MLEGIESLDPNELPDLSAARELLAEVASKAQNPFTSAPHCDIQKRAMDEERELFVQYIRTISEAALRQVEPLPYRRAIGETEAQELRIGLRDRWGIHGHYWYPLDHTERQDVVALQAPVFEREVGAGRLQSILGARRIERVWELREYGPNYEQDLSLLDPYYNGAEGYWLSKQFDWVLYASHESSLTLGGACGSSRR